jgi:hypothetical protein
MLDDPITPEWMADLARSLLEASSAGRLLQTPETALRTTEAVAAERGVAMVAFEVPAPPQPQAIVAQPDALIVETVFVPAFPLHHRSFFHQPHFRKKSFKDRSVFERRIPKNHGAGQSHLHALDLRNRPTAEGKIAGFPRVRSHSVQSGSTDLTTGGSTDLTTGGSTGLTAGGSTGACPEPVEGLTAGVREKRLVTTRCASERIGHSMQTCP